MVFEGSQKREHDVKMIKKWSKFQLKIFDLFFRNSFFLLAIKIGFLNEDMEDQNMCHTIHSIQYGPYYYSIVSAAFLGFSSSFRCFFDMTRQRLGYWLSEIKHFIGRVQVRMENGPRGDRETGEQLRALSLSLSGRPSLVDTITRSYKTQFQTNFKSESNSNLTFNYKKIILPEIKKKLASF